MPIQLRTLWNRFVRRADSHAGDGAKDRLSKRRGEAARARRRFLFEPLEDRRVMAVNFIDPNPAAGNQFGHSVVALTNGNVVVTAPFDNAGGFRAGAVYMYNGSTGELISTLRGSKDFDLVGREGVIALTNGNFLVNSSSWQVSNTQPVGAVTFGSGTTGVNGVVSAANSLIGTTAGDAVGATGSVVALPSGNYVIVTPSWDNGGNSDVGAITWGDGSAGTVGTISTTNSLTGTGSNDRVGGNGVKVLSNGNYVVTSSNWSASMGAVTWASGSIPLTGTISASNSLIGSTSADELGSRGILQLTNGNFVVLSPNWDNVGVQNAGAATWVNGTVGLSGTLNATNSLVGSTANDNVGGNLSTALIDNGNYVITVPYWDGGGFTDAGAAVWGNGTSGVKGTISSANALVGARSNDLVGINGVTALTNGHYVVNSPGVGIGSNSLVGAVTWGNGVTGLTGVVSPANSLVGSSSNDLVGFYGVAALANGNYTVASADWDNGTLSNAGAVTWGNGTTGTTGVVGAGNSMVGTRANDQIGFARVIPLTNGNYIFGSPAWHNGTDAVGAVTWRNGGGPSTGSISAANSLVGSTAIDRVGDIGSMRALSNGNYVALTANWDNVGAADAGAVTWGSGTSGVSGAISAANSLVGTVAEDKVGNNGVVELANGNYVVISTAWSNAGQLNAGAVTWVNGTTGRVGAVSSSNSLVGSTAGDQIGLNGITALSNGNYVVSSALYDSLGQSDVGAVTWANGTTGIVGTINAPSVNHAKGSSAATDLRSISLDAVNGNFFARFVAEGSGTIRVGSQSSGFDVPTVGTLTAAFSGPNLTISDGDAIGKDNFLTVSRVNVSGTDYFEFSDPVEAFTTVPITIPASTLTNSNRTLRVPASVITGSLTVNLQGGNDTLQLDLASGDVVPTNGVFFNGGNPTAATGDKLILSGGVQGNVAYNYTNASAGNVMMSSFGTVNYSGLEQPLTNTGSITDVVFSLPTLGANTVQFGDDTASGNGLSRLSGSTIVATDFPNPAGGLSLNYGTANDAVTFNALPDYTGSIVLGTGVFPLSSVTFAGPLNLAADKNVAVFAAGTISLSTANSDLSLSGAGTMLLSTARNITLASGSTITTATGSLTLEANQQAVPTAGSFVGIALSNGRLQSTSGAINVRGRGGNDGSGSQFGVSLTSGSLVGTGTSGVVTVQGTGGASAGANNYGVQVTGVNTAVTSGGGNVFVTGTGGGSGSSTGNAGVSVEANGVVRAGNAGIVTVAGTGGNTSGANAGVIVTGISSQITSSGGAVSVTGTATGSQLFAPGVLVSSSGRITAGSLGNVSVNGTSNGTGSNSFGVNVTGPASQITSAGGNVAVTGAGGGGTSATQGFGVFVDNVGTITAGGSGNVTITGTGRNLSGTGSGNHGVVLSTNGQVTSAGGNVSVTGTGGGGGATLSNIGVLLQDSGLISAIGSAAITITGTGGTGNGTANHGVSLIDLGTQINAGSGGLTMTGTPGANLSSTGIELNNNATINAELLGNVDLIADRMRINSTITADLGNIIVRPKTASRAIDLGAADSLSMLGLDDAELDRLTADLVQIGAATVSGNITASQAITSPNSLMLMTMGEVSVQNAFTMDFDKDFYVEAGSTVRLPNSTSNLNASGLGEVGITTLRNIVLSSNSRIATSDGALTLSANQQAVPTAAAFIGIELNGGILTSSTGQINLQGRGGLDASANQHGIVLTGSSGRIITSTGAIQLNGTGGGSGVSHTNYGVHLSGNAAIQPNFGTTNIQGQGGNTTGTGAINHGVVFNGVTISGTSTVTGRGGGGTSGDNYGVTSTISQTNSVGNLTAIGFGGGLLGGGNNNHGISLYRLSGTNVQLTGTGGGALGSASNYGVHFVTDGAGITSTTLVANGFGGNLTGTGGDNRGFSAFGETGLFTTGNMTINGTGGGGPTTGSNAGVALSTFYVRATGAGSINIQGTGGSNAAGVSTGVFIGALEVTAATGSINLTAAAAASQATPLRILGSTLVRANGTSGGVSFTTNGLEISTTATVNAGANPVTIKTQSAGIPIDLGGADAPGTLAISDAEFDRITAGTIHFGDNTAGTMTVTQPMTRGAETAVTLNSGSDINFTTGSLSTAGGNVTLNPNSNFTPATSSVDINAGAGSISFATGDALHLNISGFAVDTQHQQLNVVGTVNLAGASLVTVGNLTAIGGEVITIIDNDGSDPIVGTFTGLEEGATIATNFLNSGLSATISYVGGTGNDVVIIIGNPAGTTSVGVVDGDLVITDIAGGTTDDTLTISLNGDNLRIFDPNNFLMAEAEAIFIDVHTIEVPLVSITGGLLIDTLAGNDSVTLDFAGGNVIPPNGVSYFGGVGINDSLTITAGNTSSADHVITNGSLGTITLAGAIAGTIVYEGVEPIVDGLVVANRSFLLEAGAETIDVSDAPGAFNLLTSSLGHAITFANPSASLTIDAATGNDTVNINSFDSDGPFNAALAIAGGEGDDVLNLNADITFAADHNLDLDFQNDSASPGIDTINIGAAANLILSGSGTATLRASRNISLATGSSLVTANGAILVEANQQTVATVGDFVGVRLDGGVIQATAAGVVTVRGRGGNGAGGMQFGTQVTSGGAIRGGTAGTTVVQGTGGGSTANQNHGVSVTGSGSNISSLGANVQVTGLGGGTGASGANRGVDIDSDGPGTASISAGNAGNVVVNGTGSNTRLSPGVRVGGIGGLITSTTGTVQVTGQGGNGSFSFDVGVWVDAGTITSGMNGGSVTVSGLGGTSPGGINHGVYVHSSVAKTGLITSGGGALQVTGQAGNGADGGNMGVVIGTGGEITAPADNSLSITGTGGQGASGANIGVLILGKLNSTEQNITVLGTGGEGASSYGIGIDQATITIADAGNLRLQATATTAGVLSFLVGHPSTSTAISHTGTGRIEIAADTVQIESTATITNSLGIVSLTSTTAGRNINLGSTVNSTSNTLELSDLELDRITAQTLQIGDPNSGPVTFSAAITRPAATIVNVDTAAAINFTGGSLSSAGGDVRLNAGTDILPTTAGLDVSAGPTGIVRFGIGDRLTLNIAGPVVDSQHTQLNVAGQVDLTAVELVLSGTLPALGDGFIIVSNDGTDPVIGTFDGLPEGTMVDVNGMEKRLTYIGGDGNDVVLLAGNSAPTIDPISDIPLNEDAPQQTVNLTGITAGIEIQNIQVTAISAQPSLIPTPTIIYTSPSNTGTLRFTPAANQFGTTSIQVIVRDAGQDGFFNTADDAVTTTSFQVTIGSVNDPPMFNTLGDQGVVFGSGAQTVPGWASSIQPGPSNESSQTVAFSVTDNSNPALFVVAPSIAANGTLTYTPAIGTSGSATITYVAQDDGGTANGGVDTTTPRTFTITVGPELTLRILSVTPTSTGFVAEFNRQLDVAALSLYETQGGGLGPADVVLQRTGSPLPIRGSLVADSSAMRLTFVATEGLLPADDYTLTLRAAANGIVDTLGTVLDGNADSIPGGDYVQNFTVQPNPAAVTVSIPNFARGPRQDVNLPAETTAGIPISFSNGAGILSASFQIYYNPALLEITDATLAASLPPGAFVTAFSFEAGVLEVNFSSTDPLPVGTTHFMNLVARVPDDAPYGAKQVLDIRNIQLSNNTPAIDDDAIAVAAFFGDVTANGTYSAQDASFIARMAVGIDTGLAAFKMLDPVIIGDLTGNGAFSATDTSLMLRAAVGIAVPQIPSPLPTGSLLFGGPDPKLSVPRNLSAVPGQSLIIPVDIDSIENLTGNGLASADLVLYFDPAVIEVTEVRLGQLLANRAGWMISSHIDPVAGRIDISIAGTRSLEGKFIGELLQLQATVREDAPAGSSAINLAANSRRRQTQLNEGFLTLIPAPTDSPDDAIDGLLTVTSAMPTSAVPTARLENNRLLITGTAGNDQLLIAPTADGTQLMVRANNRILGHFAMPEGIAIDGFTGQDYVYIDPTLPATLLATSADDALQGIAEDFIFAGDNVELIDSPETSGSRTAGAGQPLSLNDLALLQLLDQYINDHADHSPNGIATRRRR